MAFGGRVPKPASWVRVIEAADVFIPGNAQARYRPIPVSHAAVPSCACSCRTLPASQSPGSLSATMPAIVQPPSAEAIPDRFPG